MTKLREYNNDGADGQSKAVLGYLQQHPNIEESWNRISKQYIAEPKVARWENGREQGYIISLQSQTHQRQLNIAFFEHRNSDNICAIKWEQCSMNSITIDTAEFGDVYETKWDVSHTEGYGNAQQMAEWIKEQLVEFWIESRTKSSNN